MPKFGRDRGREGEGGGEVELGRPRDKMSVGTTLFAQTWRTPPRRAGRQNEVELVHLPLNVGQCPCTCTPVPANTSRHQEPPKVGFILAANHRLRTWILVNLAGPMHELDLWFPHDHLNLEYNVLQTCLSHQERWPKVS